MKNLILSCLIFSSLSMSFLSAYANNNQTQLDKLAKTNNISKQQLTNMLIGTWQCRFDDTNEIMGISYHSTLTFNADGTFTSQKTSHTKNPDSTYQVDVTRSWLLSSLDDVWLLQEKIININHFSVDNPDAEKVFDVQQMLSGQDVHESLMIFEKKDGKDMLTRIDPIWGMAFGECIKNQ